MQVTLHTHLHNLLSVGENSSLTVESNVDPFYQVVPNTVFDDSARIRVRSLHHQQNMWQLRKY